MTYCELIWHFRFWEMTPKFILEFKEWIFEKFDKVHADDVSGTCWPWSAQSAVAITYIHTYCPCSRFAAAVQFQSMGCVTFGSPCTNVSTTVFWCVFFLPQRCIVQAIKYNTVHRSLLVTKNQQCLLYHAAKSGKFL